MICLLAVNLETNKRHLARILHQTGSDRRQALQKPGHYGFFAATMFRARLDAIKPITR